MSTYHLCTDTTTYSELPETLVSMGVEHCAIKMPLYFDIEFVRNSEGKTVTTMNEYLTGTQDPSTTLDQTGTTFIIKDMSTELLTFITLRGLPLLLLDLSKDDQTSLFPDSFLITADRTVLKFLG